MPRPSRKGRKSNRSNRMDRTTKRERDQRVPEWESYHEGPPIDHRAMACMAILSKAVLQAWEDIQDSCLPQWERQLAVQFIARDMWDDMSIFTNLKLDKAVVIEKLGEILLKIEKEEGVDLDLWPRDHPYIDGPNGGE